MPVHHNDGARWLQAEVVAGVTPAVHVTVVSTSLTHSFIACCAVQHMCLPVQVREGSGKFIVQSVVKAVVWSRLWRVLYIARLAASPLVLHLPDSLPLLRALPFCLLA